jgi:dTDP-4-amino-4,6-dideoxygalactose transaminase
LSGSVKALGVANGTDALQLAFMALDLPAGSEVITPAFSYAALAEVLFLLNLNPVFVEVDPHTFLMDIEAARAAIGPHTRAIAPVHLYGQTADMKAIMELAAEHKLYVVEDCAQALGSQYCSDELSGFAGTLGHIGCTSFFPSKNLGCMGDGGMVFTRDAALAARLRALANHGQEQKYQHRYIGLNSRLDTLQAAILLAKWPHLKDFGSRRAAAAQRYDEALSGHAELAVPARSPLSTHVFHQYTLTLQNPAHREPLRQKLAAAGIPSMVYYPTPLHRQEAYATALAAGRGRTTELSGTEDLCHRVISLPICPELELEQQHYICEQLKAALASL